MNKQASPDEKHIGRCSIDNAQPFFDAIALSGLSENQVIRYTESEFIANFQGTMKFLSKNSVDSIYTKGSGGEILLGNIRYDDPDALHNRYIFVSTFRPDNDNVLDQDPILIPYDGTTLGPEAYRIYHGDWDYRTIDASSFNAISAIAQNQRCPLSAIPYAVPELSGMYSAPVDYLESELRKCGQ